MRKGRWHIEISRIFIVFKDILQISLFRNKRHVIFAKSEKGQLPNITKGEGGGG